MPEKKKQTSSGKENIGAESSVEADDPSEEMNAEEQDAFNKIMGEIEGSGDGGASPDEDTLDSDDGTMSEADFAAELEKVVREADDGTEESGDAASDGDDGDDLDEDQLKAFESIMSQIEGGGEDDGAPKAGEEAADSDDEAVSDADFAAELEKVAREADSDTADDVDSSEKAGGATGPEEKKDDADASSDDALDSDQQEAFESIMTQIEGGKSEEDEPGDEQEVAEPTPLDTEVPGADPANDDAREATDEVTADIDDILEKVTVEEEDDREEGASPETITAKTASSPDSTGAARQVATDGENVPPGTGAPASGADSKKAAKAPDNAPVEKPATKALPEDRAAIRFKPLPSADSGNDAPEKTATALNEAGKPGKNRWKNIVLGASVVVVLFVGLAGYLYWQRQPARNVEPEAVATQSVAREADIEPDPTPPPEPPAPPDPRASDPSGIESAAESLDRLREQLLEKKAEIEELRAYYQAGIDAEINGIVDLLKTTDKDSAAMADPRIGLGLSAIQRRDAYIRKLQRPVEELTWNSEELLYFSRKAELLALMATKTSDIDIDGFVRQSREIIDSHTRALEALNIDDVQVTPLPTEAIWNDITRRIPKKPAKAASANPKTDNDLISEQICSGNYSRKHQLTVLSPKTARCLAQWKGKDLFLNELKELDPEAARQLATWKGEWLGLNGIEELSPEAAAHLSRWKGKGLSLNGLSRLSPRVVAILSEWQGDQIELVNVKHMAHWENPKTRLFLSEEMKRKRRAAKD